MSAICRLLLFALGTGLIAGPVNAPQAAEIEISERATLPGPQAQHRMPPDAAYQLTLTLVYFTGGVWPRDAAVGAAREAAKILQQCGVVLRQLELVRVAAPPRYHYFDTPVSRELAGALRLTAPAVYFVTDTRQQPAFDAEAIGRSNSRTRPELADSVWLTHPTRNPGIALAHELVHVLSDSGEHVEMPGNLMREEAAPANTRLTHAQCARVRDTGVKNGLLRRKQR